MIYAETVAEGVKKYWGQDPVLAAAVPSGRFFTRRTGLEGVEPPYVSLDLFTPSTPIKLGDHYFFHVMPGAMRIYGTEGVWRLSQRAALALEHLPRFACYQGDVCDCTVSAGQSLDLPNGITMVEHQLAFQVVESRSPKRLRTN